MGRATWIADALRDAGLTVREHPGWEGRGSSDFDPRGVVCHHTASATGSNVPSLGICVNGRSDLPGPLCQLLIARDATCYVIAAGRANHAGTGGWRGLSGNSSVLGIEVENNGVGEPWNDKLLDAFHRSAGALLDRIGASTDMCCYHREWTSRKIDPAGPGIPQDGDLFRDAVQTARDGGDEMTDADWKKLGEWMYDQDDRIVARVKDELAGDDGVILGPLQRANGYLRSIQKKLGIPIGETVKNP